MESVKICHFKTFRAGNFAFRTFCCFFLHYIHVKKFVCEDISAEYEFESEKFKGDRLKIKPELISSIPHGSPSRHVIAKVIIHMKPPESYIRPYMSLEVHTHIKASSLLYDKIHKYL